LAEGQSARCTGSQRLEAGGRGVLEQRDRSVIPRSHRFLSPLAEGRNVSARPPASERLANPDALLTRGDLAELGLERRAVDAVFRACPVVALPGYSRPMIRVSDYQALMESSTYRGDRVRPTTSSIC